MSSIDLESAVRTAVDDMPIGALLATVDGRILYANRQAQQIFDVTAEQLVASGDQCLNGRTMIGRANAQCIGTTVGHGPVKAATRGGAPLLLQMTPTLLRSGPRDVRVLCTIADVTQQIRLQRRTEAYCAVYNALLRQDDMRAVLEMAALHACIVFDAAFASITMPYPAGKGLTLAAHSGDDGMTTERSWPPDSLLREVWESSAPRLIPGPASGPESPDSSDSCGFVVPIASADMAIGVLSIAVAHIHPHHRDDDFASAADYGSNIGQAFALGLDLVETRRRAQRTAQQLEKALEQRATIEQAKGMVAATERIDTQEAFAHIRAYARTHDKSIHGVAVDIVDRKLRL